MGNVNDHFLNGSWMYLLDLFGSSITKHHRPSAGDELSYTRLGKHLNDMAVQLILKPLCLPNEIIVRRESAEISVGITDLGSGESLFWGFAYPQKGGGINYTYLPSYKNDMQSLLIFFSFPLHYAFFGFFFLLKHFWCALSRLLGVAGCSLSNPLWVHRGWSSEEPAKSCQRTPVQLKGGDTGVVAVDLEEAMP